MVAERAEGVESSVSASARRQKTALNSAQLAPSGLIWFEAYENLMHLEEIHMLSSPSKRGRSSFFAAEGWIPWSRHTSRKRWIAIESETN